MHKIEYKIEWPRKSGVLTPAYMEKVAKHVRRLEFKPTLLTKGFIPQLGAADYDVPYCDRTFVVKIDRAQNEEEQVITFIHELLHIAFYICGYEGDVEDFVEEETQKFCKEHPIFAQSLFEQTKKTKSLA